MLSSVIIYSERMRDIFIHLFLAEWNSKESLQKTRRSKEKLSRFAEANFSYISEISFLLDRLNQDWFKQKLIEL